MAFSLLAMQLAEAWPPADWREVTVVLAVSGGADSVALLRAMHELKGAGPGRLVAAHWNHRLRGAASDEDEEFVRRTCETLGVECVAGQAEPGLGGHGLGDGGEAAARAGRYRFLRQTALACGARYVATAHTADDQVETVLHRIVRGTGISGLGGIPRVRPLAPGVTLIRPLLAFRREELRGYLQQQGHSWREDASNQLLDFTRNRLRLDLLPRLEREYNAEVDNALLRLSQLAAEAQDVVDDAASVLLEAALVSADAGESVLDTRPLLGERPFLVCEALIALWRRQEWPRGRYSHDDWRRLAALAMGAAPARRLSLTLPGAIVARREGDQLRLTRKARRGVRE